MKKIIAVSIMVVAALFVLLQAAPGLLLGGAIVKDAMWQVSSNGKHGELFLQLTKGPFAFETMNFLSVLGTGRSFEVHVERSKSRSFLKSYDSQLGPPLVVTAAACVPESLCGLVGGLRGQPANPATIEFAALSVGTGKVRVTAKAGWWTTYHEEVDIQIEAEPDAIRLEPELPDNTSMLVGDDSEKFELIPMAGGRRVRMSVGAGFHSGGAYYPRVFDLKMESGIRPAEMTVNATQAHRDSVTIQAIRPGHDTLELWSGRVHRSIPLFAVEALPSPDMRKEEQH